MRLTVPLLHDKKGDRWYVDLPTYQMVPGTEDYDAGLVQVDVPDAYDNGQGQLVDRQELAELYQEHPRFGNPDIALLTELDSVPAHLLPPTVNP